MLWYVCINLLLSQHHIGGNPKNYTSKSFTVSEQLTFERISIQYESMQCGWWQWTTKSVSSLSSPTLHRFIFMIINYFSGACTRHQDKLSWNPHYFIFMLPKTKHLCMAVTIIKLQNSLFRVVYFLAICRAINLPFQWLSILQWIWYYLR